MSGLPIDAAQALEFGLVNRVTPPDELMAQVLERARVIAGKAPLSVKALKKVVRGGAALPLDKASGHVLAADLPEASARVGRGFWKSIYGSSSTRWSTTTSGTCWASGCVTE